MEIVQRAIRQQQCSSELMQLFSLHAKPMHPRLLTLSTHGIEDQQYHRLLLAYRALAEFYTTANNDADKEFSLLMDIAAAFNYAFDAPWLLPLAKHIFTTLVHYAIHSDKMAAESGRQKPGKVKAVCVPLDVLRAKMMDRLPFPATRKAGILFTLKLIFRCYLRLDSLKQMQKVFDYVFHHVLPDAMMVDKYFCKAERVTFYYFMGKFLLIQHNVVEAEEYLRKAYTLCTRHQTSNRTRIAIHWAAAQLVMARYPSTSSPLWQRHPLLGDLFRPLIQSIQKGNIQHFNSYLCQHQVLLCRLRLYHVFSVRLPALVHRNLVRRVFVLGSSMMGSTTYGYTDTEMDTDGPKQPPRISLDDLCSAWAVAGDPLFQKTGGPGLDAFGWPQGSETLLMMVFLLARLVDGGWIKGHVLPRNRCIVVGKKNPFPALSGVMLRVMESERWWLPIQTDRQIVEGDVDDED